MPKTHSGNGALAKPFLKWAGGKTQLLPQLERLLPERFAGYHEPFVGSAAVYFHLYNLKQAGQLRTSLKRVSLTDSLENYSMVALSKTFSC